MNRRELLIAGGALMLTPMMARASETLTYTPGLIEERLAAGETVLLDFYAPWCSTCRAQERVVDALRAGNGAYDAAITFIRVDWDTYGAQPVATDRNVPRRSTLVLLRGEAELGRVVASTRSEDIQALLDAAL